MSIFLSRTKIHKNTVIPTIKQLLISLSYFYIVSRQEETRFTRLKTLNPQKLYHANQTKIQDYFKKIQPIKYLERRCFMPYIYLLIAIITEIIGTSFLKSAEGFTKLWPTLGTLISFGICFTF